MCRMIAATGDFDPRALGYALRRMAANDNPDHIHEKRDLGEQYRHEDGWGAAWVEGGDLHVRHSIHSCLADPLFAEVEDLETEMLMLHARRASRPGTVRLENTHPFLVEHRGRTWAFCHNGTVHDLRSLRPANGLVPGGNMDSEVLFHHVLNHLDSDDPEASLLASLDVIEDYTALLCLLATTESVIATAKRHPQKGLPEYHALWEGKGRGLHVVSSEPMEGIGVDDWEKLRDPAVVTLRRRVRSDRRELHRAIVT